MSRLSLEEQSDRELLGSRLKGTIESGGKMVLVHLFGSGGKWLLLDSSLYSPQFEGEMFWNGVSSHATQMKYDMKKLLHRGTRLSLLKISTHPIVLKASPKHSEDTTGAIYMVIGILRKTSSTPKRIYKVSTFLRRKHNLSGINGNLFVVISGGKLVSYFLLKAKDVKLVANFLDDLINEDIRNISFLTFQEPKVDVVRTMMGEPPGFLFQREINDKNDWENIMRVLKKVFGDYAHPVLYDIGDM